MDMVSRIYVDDLPALVRAGRIPMAVVNEAVRRVLRGKAALGLFDDPYHGATPERERSVLLAPEHRQLAVAWPKSRSCCSKTTVLCYRSVPGAHHGRDRPSGR